MPEKLCFLWHNPFGLVDQGELQKGSVHVNWMKQYFTFDDPLINSPPQRNPRENPPEEIYKLLELFTESPCNREIELSHNVFPDNSRNLITNHIEDLEEITTLPELTKPLQLKQKKKNQDKDNHFSINTLPNCEFNHGKQSVTH